MSWLTSAVGWVAGTAEYVFGGGSAAEEQGKALDAKLAEMNQAAYDRGLFTPAQYAQVQQDQQTGATDAQGTVYDQLTQAGTEGAQQGLDTVTALPGQVVGGVLGVGGEIAGKTLWGIVKSIPWWVWLGAALGIFFYFGGFKLLKGAIRRNA